MFSSYAYNWLESILFFAPARYSDEQLRGALKGKTVFITGASFGIGEQLALELSKAGAHLILAARTAEKLSEIKETIKSKGGDSPITIFPVDLTKRPEVETLLDELGKFPGGIDVFVSNAGKSIRRPIFESLDRLHDFERTMALNYFAPVQLMLGLIPLLEQTRGHVINISAVNVALPPAPFWAAYQASKTAFDQWFRAAAPELFKHRISATSVYLPLVRTRMIEPTEAYKNAPAMNPRHVARIVAKLILTKKTRFAPWWLFPAEAAAGILRRPWEALASYFVK